MEYKTIPFNASITSSSSSSDAANQLQSAIDAQVTGGWEFCTLANISTNVAGDSGCFGIGAKPGYNTSVQVLVFRK